MLERTMRSSSGAVKVLRVAVGRITAAHDSQPDTGSSRHCTENNKISMLPVQNTGIDCPRNTVPAASCANARRQRTVLQMPTDSAIATSLPTDDTVSISVNVILSCTSAEAN